MIKFGPSGNSIAFAEAGNKTSEQYFGGVWNRLENLSVIAEWEEDFSTNAGYTDRY